ncbi:MAG: hypothetical protein HUJ51_03695 [Eggerthellaceae bacterium]|nr:hypothetical protein [Eggerthellaceae bacterium]
MKTRILFICIVQFVFSMKVVVTACSFVYQHVKGMPIGIIGLTIAGSVGTTAIL